MFSALVDAECLAKVKKHFRVVAELSGVGCKFLCFVSMAYTPEQFNVIVEMVKQITLAQQAAWNNVARWLTPSVSARLLSEAMPKNGETGHSRSTEP